MKLKLMWLQINYIIIAVYRGICDHCTKGKCNFQIYFICLK